MIQRHGLRASRGGRFFLVPLLLFVWFAVLVCRLCSLHLGEHPLRNNIETRGKIPARRGVIYDRGGNAIAVNRPGYMIFVDPKAPVKPSQSKKATASRIADLTGRKATEVYDDLTRSGQKVSRYIKQGITYDVSAVDLVTNSALYCGVGIEPVTIRLYPQGEYFAHILGFISGQDQVGRNGGVEQYAEKYLCGTPGFYEGIKTQRGEEIRERRKISVQPIDGASVHLTVDHNIQHALHDALAEAMAEYKADGVRGIVQLVKTGEILAIDSLPTFSPTNIGGASEFARKNRAITDAYDPGSTMKSIVVAAALNEGVVTPESRYDLGGGPWFYGGHFLNDHVHGIADVRKIIAKSSNIGAAKIGLDLGNRRLEAYMKAFGFSAQTGIELPGESRGIMRSAKTWDVVTPTRISIGQGISVTPIQMINAYSTIANGGNLMRPYVVDKIISPHDETLLKTEPRIIGKPVKPSVCGDMREMLREVVSARGTARRASPAGYSAAGKTGTAQMLTRDASGKYVYSRTDYWASFIGFIPADCPVFSVLIVIDRPAGTYNEGGMVAAPVFAKVASFVARYLEIPAESPPQ